MNARSLAILLTLFTLSCSGSSTTPPPAASPTPGGASDGMQPLTARDGEAPPLPPGGEPGSLPPGHPPIEGMPPATGDAPASGEAVTGTITLAEALGAGILASDVLYVMARKDGATVAVRRVEAPSFPFSFEVSGSDSMMAGTALSGTVDIVARVSKTGDAIASAGDLEGTTTGVAVPAQGVTLTIDRVRE